MSFRFTIARRYLASPRRVTLVSVISTLSVLGVALGVTALIVVLSVMNGFFDLVRDLLVSFDPHVRIEMVEGRVLADPDAVLATAWEVEGVESAAAYVEGRALLSYGATSTSNAVVVRGVDWERFDEGVGDLRVSDAVTSGEFRLGQPAEGVGPPGAVVGSTLGLQLGLYPGLEGEGGSRIALLSAAGFERLLTQPLGLPPQQPFSVTGIYELQQNYDRSYVFVDLADAQRLFQMPNQISGVELRLADLDRAEEVRRELERRLPPDQYRVSTWYDLQRALYDVMRLEKWGATFILMLIIVVAAFNIVGSLTMIVIEKRRDLGALRAMGATQDDIRRIFLLEGLLVGSIGAGLGLVLGLGLTLLQQATGFVPLAQADAFIIDSYPVAIRALDVTLITLVAITLCVLAAIYPASRAAAIEPAEAVRAGS